jgi:hypothetical protein
VTLRHTGEVIQQTAADTGRFAHPYNLPYKMSKKGPFADILGAF